MHNPGPWDAVEWTAEAPFPIGVAVAVQKRGTRDASGRICEMVAQGDGKYSPETTTANARLIAAAPALLEALREALVYIRECADREIVPTTDGDGYHAAMRAIAAAEGRLVRR